MAAGRVADTGGPERLLAAQELARQWEDAAVVRRKIVRLALPGRTFAGYAAGHNLVPGPAYGTRTFADFLTERYG